MSQVAILGAGSLGQLWAGYLPAGRAVFLARPPSSAREAHRASAVLEYRIRHPDGSDSARRITLAPITSIRPELLLVTTKAGDTLAALAQTLPDIDETVPVVLFQNGMGGQQSIAERWPDRPILAATTTEGANRPEPGVLVHVGRGETWVGGLTESGRHCAEATVTKLATSGLVIHTEADIQQRLWHKLVVNAGINAFTTILDCANGEILAQPFFLEHIDQLCEELATVMAQDTPHPLSAGQIKERIYAVATSTAANTSSMRGDYHRGRTTEIDVINGYIVKQGQNAGIPTPVNQMLSQRVKQLT